MRTKRKPQKKKKSLRSRLFLFLLLLLILSAGIYSLLSLPIWKIQEVVVSGANMLSSEEIRDLSGIPVSENLFLTSFSRARNNLKKISAIKDFRIYRIPPATVLIKITERKPIAVMVLQDKSVVVDEEGYILNRNPNLTLNIPNMTDLPAISVIGTQEVIAGEKVDPKIAQIVTDIVLKLSSLLGSRKIHLELGSLEKISFLLDDLLRVKIGRDEDIKRKMAVFERLLPVITNKWSQVEYVDVRFPDNPVILFK